MGGRAARDPRQRVALTGSAPPVSAAPRAWTANERSAARSASAARNGCPQLTVTYVHSVLKSALEHAVREDELPRNVARNVKAATPRPRHFRPLTATKARQFLDAARTDRLHALYELALRTGLRKANSWASSGKTSTSQPERPASAARSSAPAPAASRICPPRPGHLSAVSRSRPNASTLSRSTNSSRTRSAGRQGQPGRTAASSSPPLPAGLSTRPTSPAASATSSTGPDSDASASTTSGTRPPPCSSNKASTSSSSRNSSDTPTSASPPASTPTSDSASNAKPSTPSESSSHQPTRTPTTHPLQPSSADVAVTVAVKAPESPTGTTAGGALRSFGE